MRSVICECGKTFETKHSHKIYCSSKCQIKYSVVKYWNNSKLDYKNRCGQLAHMAKNRAKTSNLFYDISKEYVSNLWEEHNGCCAISGRQFDMSRPEEETVRKNAPSLDRINPSKGYTQGNVRLVCYQVNTALNEYGEQALISLCKDILEYNKGIIA